MHNMNELNIKLNKQSDDQNGRIKFTKHVTTPPAVTEFVNPDIENPAETLMNLGFIPRQGDQQKPDLKQAATKAREAVSGYATSNGARKAVETLADAIESIG